MKCEGQTPETTITKTVERDAEQQVEIDGEVRTVTVRMPHTEIEVVPPRPCDTEATILARSMDEQECNLGGVHWVTIEDHYYCPPHFVPGRMAHLDGRNTDHAPMAIEDA
jgi:hypothetical protein